jgi:hypothetical protein
MTFAVRPSRRLPASRVAPPMSAIFVLVAVSACGSGRAGGAGSGSLPFDMWGTAFVAARCKERVVCGVYPDLATCIASTPVNLSELATLKVDIASGKVVYDSAAAASCVALYNGVTSCLRSQLDPQQVVTVCDSVFLGTVPGGGACFFNVECASASCPLGCTSGLCCAGTCDDVTTPIPVGGDCSRPAAGQGCVSGSTCGYGSGTTLVGTCLTPPTTVGAACTSGVGCGSSLYCNADAATGMGTCKQVVLTGGACSDWTSCDDARDSCDPISSLCTAPTPIGGACVPTAPHCVADASCNATTSTCQAEAKLGEGCSNLTGPSCLSGLICNGTTLTCVPSLPATGAACM